MRPLLIAIAFAAFCTLSACGIFGGGDESVVEQPAELVEFESSLRVRRVWNQKVGDGTERLRLGLAPATDGSKIFAGSHDGRVSALDSASGRRIWSIDTELSLAAGPAFGAGSLVFGTNNGELIALEAETGQERWRRQVGSEVLASPAIGGNTVVFRSVDGRLRGYSVADGTELWSIEQSMPALTLRGNSAPRVSGTVVVSGFDNGRVGAYALSDGDTRWEMAIAAPAGRNELDRLVDITGGVQIVGNDVYVAGYNGRAVGIDLLTGLAIWQQDLSSFAGLGVDANNVYVADEFGAVLALNRLNGNIVWTQDALRLRDVTAPARFGRAVIVGDFEGYLHWLDSADGRFLARARGANGRIAAPPLVVGLNVYVQGDDGSIAAFEIVDESA
jgi:outer membrane protein assembly factor BamB